MALRIALITFIIATAALAYQPGQSLYTERPNDPNAVYLTKDNFPVYADGVGDDAPALQAAIDAVAAKRSPGIVFIPSGSYRLGDTVRIWWGVRLIGYGAERPTLLLGENTPGFAAGTAKYLLHFSGWKPKPGEGPQDASNTTFYSGASNLNIEIRAGNPDAVGVRFFVAQHSSLEHIDFRIGSGMGGVEQAGNEIEDCRFFGGRYGIKTHTTSPSWQYLVLDCTFEGQRTAAIQTSRAGLTLVRALIRRTPLGVVVPSKEIEELYVKDTRFEQVACAIRMAEARDQKNQLNVENATCDRVPTFLTMGDTRETLSAPSARYAVRDLRAGLHIEGNKRAVKTVCDARRLRAMPPLAARDYPELPPMAQWVNVRDLGAVGDDKTDDTAALKKAVAEHRVLYFPMGRYRVTDTLVLRPDTVVIGLNPGSTFLTLAENTPGFTDPAQPKAILEAPQGGRNLVTGIGTRASGPNPGMVAVKWMAGADSCLDDVHFAYYGGRGRPKGTGLLHSLWVTDGGGGTFKNIWAPDVHTQDGLRVTNTSTVGRIYLMSIEHHLTNECIFDQVRNWQVYALQTEENLGSEKATALTVRDCENILFANQFHYRVMAITASHPQAIVLNRSRGIVFRGLHVFSWGPKPFDNALLDEATGIHVPERELTFLEAASPSPRP